MIEENNNDEVWLTIPTHPNYEVSNKGQVRRAKNQRIVKQNEDESGYKVVTIYTDKKYYCRKVSRLVWTTFNDSDCNLTIDHRDRNKQNNNISNLRCISHRDNSRNRDNYSNKLNKYNLTDELKKELISKFRSKEWSTYYISKQFGIQSNYMCMVAKRGSWDKLLENDGGRV